MAFSFGSGINPQLGATDYGAVSRGAQVGAQMNAQGQAAIGQGIGSALQSIGSAVVQYNAKQEQKKQEEAAITTFQTIGKENPELVKMLGIGDLEDKSLLKSVVKSLGGAGAALQIGQQLQKAADQQKSSDAIRASMAGAPKSASEFLSSYIGAGGQNLGEAAQIGNVLVNEQEASNKANRQPPGRVMTLDQINGLKTAGFDVKGVPQQDGTFLVQSMDTFAPPSQTIIKTGDDVTSKQLFSEMAKLRENASVATNARRSYEQAKSLLADDKLITGAGADIRLAAAKIGSLFGIDNPAIANTEVMRAQLAQPVFALVKGLGSGTGISDNDVKFAKQAAGGEISLDGATIKRLVDLGDKATKLTVDSYNQRLDKVYPKGDKESGQTRSFFELTPAELSMPEQQPQTIGKFRIISVK